MLAPSFDILEDNELSVGPSSTTQNLGGATRKGLGLRAGGSGNVQLAAAGPQKSVLQSGSSSTRKPKKLTWSTGTADVTASSSKTRAFGAVLATDNSNNSAAPHSSGKKQPKQPLQQQQQQQPKPKSFTAAKAGPTPLRSKAQAVLRPRHENIPDVEVCHKGPCGGMAADFLDGDEVELLRTNEKARILYHQTAAAAMLIGSATNGCGPVVAPLDDNMAFGIFEDDEEEIGGADGQAAAATPAAAVEFDGADLW
jgi:hypothetical protein